MHFDKGVKYDKLSIEDGYALELSYYLIILLSYYYFFHISM